MAAAVVDSETEKAEKKTRGEGGEGFFFGDGGEVGGLFTGVDGVFFGEKVGYI